MIARRSVLDLGESWIFQMAGQHNVAHDPVSPQADSGKAHSHLKRNPRFLGNHADATAASYELGEGSKQIDRMWCLSGEMFG